MPLNDKKDILLNQELFIIKPLTENIDVSGFFASYSLYTSFLKNHAKNYKKYGIATTFLICNRESDIIVAYFSLMPGSLNVYNDNIFEKNFLPEGFPSTAEKIGTIHIYYLAASRDFEDEYYHIVQYIINSVQYLIAKKLSSTFNFKYITLDADCDQGNENIVSIYEKAGFKQIGNDCELPLMILPVQQIEII